MSDYRDDDLDSGADALRDPLRRALDAEAALHGAPSVTWGGLHRRMVAAGRRRRALQLSCVAATVVVVAIAAIVFTHETERSEPVKTIDGPTSAPARSTAPLTSVSSNQPPTSGTKPASSVPTTRPPTSGTTQPPPARFTNLRAVQFVSSRTGFAVGSVGTILRTDDAGRTWHGKKIDVAANFDGRADLYSVDMLNARTGWVYGPQVDLFTTDGWHWFEASNGAAGKPMYRAHFWSPTDGIGIAAHWLAAGEPPADGVLVRSTDGGRRWSVVAGAPSPVQSVCATGPDDVWAAGAFVWHSIDAGATWANTLPAPDAGSDADLQCGRSGSAWVQYTVHNAAAGHVPYVLYATRDGGARWRVVLDEPTTIGNQVPAPAGPGSYPGPFSLIDADTAFVTGPTPAAGHTSGVLVTGGSNVGPARVIRPFNEYNGPGDLEGVSFVDADHGWAVGQVDAQAVIAATSDGGRTWSRQYP